MRVALFLFAGVKRVWLAQRKPPPSAGKPLFVGIFFKNILHPKIKLLDGIGRQNKNIFYIKIKYDFAKRYKSRVLAGIKFVIFLFL